LGFAAQWLYRRTKGDEPTRVNEIKFNGQIQYGDVHTMNLKVLGMFSNIRSMLDDVKKIGNERVVLNHYMSHELSSPEEKEAFFAGNSVAVEVLYQDYKATFAGREIVFSRREDDNGIRLINFQPYQVWKMNQLNRLLWEYRKGTQQYSNQVSNWFEENQLNQEYMSEPSYGGTVDLDDYELWQLRTS
jgi:hypothetical protein